MKRNAVLQPLSREHHTALSLGNACLRAAQSGDHALIKQSCERALQHYARELDMHFNTEELTLLPLLKTDETRLLAQRTLREHQQLRGLQEGLRLNHTASLLEFGQLLMAHVRFEERELFPALEQYLNTDH